MKKILFICNTDWFFVSHRLPIAIEAKKKGFEVYLASNLSNSSNTLLNEGIKIYNLNQDRCKLNFFTSLKLIVEIIILLRKIKPDIVHAITIKPVIFAGIALKFYGKGSFVASVTGLGYLFIKKNFKIKIVKFLIENTYKFIFSYKKIKVIFQNNYDLNHLKKITNINSSKILLIPGSGVDLNFYKPSGYNSQSNIILFASRLLISKGILEFVESAKNFQNKKYTFIVAGKLDYSNPDCISRQELKEWEDKKFIKYVGDVKNVRDIIQNSKIVVLPSYYGEGLPKILIEAAACGKPIITTDHPGCRDAIVPNLTGLLIPIKNSKELSNSINTLLNNKNLCESMGNEARKLALRKFDINLVVSKHMEIYREII